MKDKLEASNFDKVNNIGFFSKTIGVVDQNRFLIGDSLELPKWLKSGSGIKTPKKGEFLWLVEGTIGIGWNRGSEHL